MLGDSGRLRAIRSKPSVLGQSELPVRSHISPAHVIGGIRPAAPKRAYGAATCCWFKPCVPGRGCPYPLLRAICSEPWLLHSHLLGAISSVPALLIRSHTRMPPHTCGRSDMLCGAGERVRFSHLLLTLAPGAKSELSALRRRRAPPLQPPAAGLGPHAPGRGIAPPPHHARATCSCPLSELSVRGYRHVKEKLARSYQLADGYTSKDPRSIPVILWPLFGNYSELSARSSVLPSSRSPGRASDPCSVAWLGFWVRGGVTRAHGSRDKRGASLAA